MLSGGALFEAAFLLLVFIAALFVGSLVAPGREGSGPDITGNERIYRLNGLSLFLLSVLLLGVTQITGLFSLSIVYERFAALFVIANVFAFSFSLLLHALGKRARPASSGGGGGFLRDYFMGVDANPTWFGVDIKLFSYRPSLIGLAVLNASFAVAQFEATGTLTLGMTVYQIVTFLYVLNYFQFEYGMLRTWDMTSERLGWMLVWGDYVLVPFFYSLPGWWLVDAPETLSPAGAGAILAMFLLGGWIFRGANQQKHEFRENPETTIWGKPAEALGGRLLVSGFWGVARHLNYTGEILIYTSFALTTGFASPFPYVLPAWLAALLAHRSFRDDRRCRAKYGSLWERYTKRVRYTMVPYIY